MPSVKTPLALSGWLSFQRRLCADYKHEVREVSLYVPPLVFAYWMLVNFIRAVLHGRKARDHKNEKRPKI